jgi:hypothetical protein
MIRRSLLAMALVLGMVVAAAPADAQQYPPAANFLTVSDTTPTPGQTITITSGTYLAGTTVTITFFSQPVNLGSGIASAVGTVSVQGTIPADTPLGQHTVQASGQTAAGPLTQSVSVTVVAAESAGGGTSGSLARTGDDSSIPLTRVAAVLVATGGALVFVARRRRQRRAAAA